MATCYCGCGTKVKLTRRAFNGTGRLVRIQLDAWDQREELIREAGAWTPGLEGFLGVGREMETELLGITHGGPVRLTRPQAEITKWLTRSRSALVEAEAAGYETVADAFADQEPSEEPPTSEEPAPEDEIPAPTPIDPDLRSARRAEIAAIRNEYEGSEETEQCPTCGQTFTDPGAYLAHVAADHSE